LYVLQVVDVLNHVWKVEACQAHDSTSFVDVPLEKIYIKNNNHEKKYKKK